MYPVNVREVSEGQENDPPATHHTEAPGDNQEQASTLQCEGQSRAGHVQDTGGRIRLARPLETRRSTGFFGSPKSTQVSVGSVSSEKGQPTSGISRLFGSRFNPRRDTPKPHLSSSKTAEMERLLRNIVEGQNQLIEGQQKTNEYLAELVSDPTRLLRDDPNRPLTASETLRLSIGRSAIPPSSSSSNVKGKDASGGKGGF